MELTKEMLDYIQDRCLYGQEGILLSRHDCPSVNAGDILYALLNDANYTDWCLEFPANELINKNGDHICEQFVIDVYHEVKQKFNID